MCKQKNKYIKRIVILLILMLLFNLWCNFKIVIVSGESMQPTYNNNQILFARRTNTIKRNTVIVFNADDKLNIKRVIGVVGDCVKLENGKIYINGVQIKPYTYYGETKTIYLGDNEYFVIGDNYQNSFDSRNYGAINANHIYGVII